MIYCFKCPACGKKAEVFRTISECKKPEECPVCTEKMKRDFRTEQGGKRINEGWPMVSVAAGINPDQVGEYREFDKTMGVPTEYNSDGDVVFTSRAHRKRYCEAHRLFDRNGGYGDPQRK